VELGVGIELAYYLDSCRPVAPLMININIETWSFDHVGEPSNI
jgi:hypothetical protein